MLYFISRVAFLSVYEMNALGIVLIARLGSFCRIADVNDTERNVLSGHLESCLKIALYPLMRICATPNCTET